MEKLITNLKVNVNQNLYLIDPYSSSLGKKIVVNSIDLINNIGFEKFTFRKLGEKIKSPEASVYRYFKSKDQLLSYLVSWYWGWMEYKLVFVTANIESAEVSLQKAIELISIKNHKKENIDGIEIDKLINIIISESAKSYLTKEVTRANKEGAFLNYKNFVSRIVKIINKIKIINSFIPNF